jgi:glycosyltransferase involved in cell wall biosynthesis
MSIQTVAVITCQPDPDYVRARAIRAGIAKVTNVKLVVVKNSYRGIMRYPEVAFKLIRTRLTDNPDVYILTFRGYEMLPYLLIVAMGKRVVFDEFINAIEWAAYEHKKFNPTGVAGKIFNKSYGWLLRRCETVLTDTEAHADLSAELSNVPRKKYFSLPVGTDETVFFPSQRETVKTNFHVFFYGNILPLHGLPIMVDAALRLKNNPSILFTFIGGKPVHRAAIERAISEGARITYISRVPFKKLPDYVHSASLCLGGPFGNTFQSQYVVTGKTYQFLAAGAPTVVGASKASGAFRHSVNSLVVPQGDGAALAEVISWAYAHPDRLAAIGKAGRKLYETEFSNDIIADRLAVLLQRSF